MAFGIGFFIFFERLSFFSLTTVQIFNTSVCLSTPLFCLPHPTFYSLHKMFWGIFEPDFYNFPKTSHPNQIFSSMDRTGCEAAMPNFLNKVMDLKIVHFLTDY